MKPHIQHKSHKPMATGSTWGRLLTIAFLCLFFCMGVLVNSADAVMVTVRNNGDGYGTIDFGPAQTPPHLPIDITPGFNQSIDMPSAVYLLNPSPNPGSVFASLTKVPPNFLFPIDATTWLVNPVSGADIIYVDFYFDQYTVGIDAETSPAAVAEGSTATIKVTVFPEVQPGDTVTVDLSPVAGTAIAGTDYTLSESGSLIFSEGETEKTIIITAIDDLVVEPTEDYLLEISSPNSALYPTET